MIIVLFVYFVVLLGRKLLIVRAALGSIASLFTTLVGCLTLAAHLFVKIFFIVHYFLALQ